MYLAGAVGIGIFLICAINLTIRAAAGRFIYEPGGTFPSAQVAVIPGAALRDDGTPSPIFLDRVDAAIALYKNAKVSKILVSGDNSTVSHNEVNPVRTYLLSKGVPDQDIFLDHAGFDTYSTMYRARSIFGITSMLITTQSFHLPRAVFIARALGINAYGVNADNGNSLFRNYIREVLANEKAVFDLVFHVQPKYLGEQIPITGDGRSNP
jgi:SanA protein